MTIKISNTYESLNESSSKELTYVLVIEGLPYIIGSSIISTKLRYGYPGIEYGDPGLTYGCLVPWGGLTPSGTYDPNKQRPYLNIDKSGMTLTQKIEQWEGKSSISTLSFVLTDVNQEVLSLCSPGIELDEILLKRCEFWVGYKESSYPDDYIRVYRGIISSFRHEPGLVTLGTSDANVLRRQKIWESTKTFLTSSINNTTTTIPVIATDGFYKLINAPGETYPESGHQIGIKIDDEIITYTDDPTSNQFVNVTRGALGTVAANHDIDSEVTPVFYMEGNPFRLACKLMLSGWGGAPFLSGVKIYSFVYTGDSNNLYLQNSVNFSVDVKAKYGLNVGDYVTINGATNPGNNVVEKKIIDIISLNGIENSVIVLDATLTVESITNATASFRSQFDVYPIECGIKMTPEDVDVERHIKIANEFVIDEVALFKFTITEEEDSLKSFIEKELYAPCGAFSLTRGGRMSTVVTAPPLPTEDVITLSDTSIINAEKAVLDRSVNSRKFYNVVSFDYDHDAIDGKFYKVEKFIDSDSLSKIPIREYIQIESRGMRSDQNAGALTERVSRRLFARYGRAAQTIQIKTTWQVGALLEPGDPVILDDDGKLLLPDLSSGQRGIQISLWEVLEKSIDFKSGQTSLVLINGTGENLFDRFGVISPSSEIEQGISTSKFRIKEESFGALFQLAEYKKWEDYIGSRVAVFSDDFSTYEESVLIGIGEADQFTIEVSPGFSFVPSPGMVLSLAEYDPNESLAKVSHAFLSPAVQVVNGISDTEFDVSMSDINKFWVGGIVRVHNEDYTIDSGEVKVISISGNTVEVSPSLGFTPSSGHMVSYIGFSSDKTQTYRFYA